MQPDFVEQIVQILQETELNARSLKLEITESVIMEMTKSVSKMTAQLKAMNIQLQMDDFGIGYSSLSSLHHLPIDVLKIDRSFVSRMEEESSSKIVQTIVALAHSLGLDVTAEGIETAEQLEQLKGFSCEMGQGYYFSKPLAVYAVDALIAARVNSQASKPHIKCRWQVPFCA
jgi:EAL domain-containing protein (putative c-di-GMP-specific phosphodiesterase class I)